MHPSVESVVTNIEERSKDSRQAYLELIRSRRPDGLVRSSLTEGNLAHVSAGCAATDKIHILGGNWPNIAVVTAYNDMLSAHAPYEAYPQIIREAARKAGATAQVAGGVPAMCDGVTQGQEGMELSLFSRDVIALATAVSLSHNAFDAALYLGICDKIVPGLLIAALRFGWLPSLFVPSGPMPSGLPNPEKQKVRQAFALGQVGRDALLKAETESYHSLGTCTFYGTANSNQMLMEVMGLHMPGAAFVAPGTDLRTALTESTVNHVANITVRDQYTPLGETLDARSFANAIVGLMATGGSTNHALHIPAIAAAAGYHVTLEDMAQISSVTPLLCRIYPNGEADVNHFHAAGGMGFLIRELIQAGLIDGQANGVFGKICNFAKEPWLSPDGLQWRDSPEQSGDSDVLRSVSNPFSEDGGLKLLDGVLGRGVIKVSAVKPENRFVRAPARVFESQEDFKKAFIAGELDRDVTVVVRYQGPAANGMPELHGLSPSLGALQDKGYKVALITDGRLSGATGKVPSAIHISPEASHGGSIAKLQDGDVITLDAYNGRLEVEVELSELENRQAVRKLANNPNVGLGREMFSGFRSAVSDATSGGSAFNFLYGTP